MTVILGSDGGIQFDLGNGLVCVANVFSWSANLGRETLDTTKQGDEARTRTGGLADHTGSVSLRLQFSDDTAVNSAWQILNHVLTNSDDDLKASLKLILQSPGGGGTCDPVFDTLIPDAVSLTGSAVITDVSLDCSDVGEPVVAVMSWEADGALTLVRG